MKESIAEILDEFKREIMPKTLQAIKAIRTENKDLERQRRIEYLKGRMEGLVFKTFYIMQDYDELLKSDDMDSRLFVGGQIVGAVKTIQKLQDEIIHLKKPPQLNGKGRAITDDMIERAKEYPWDQLIEVNRNRMAVCPFHGDKDPSFSIKNNFGYCFGCQWKGDQIKFLMERDGVRFADAVRSLQ
jgi:hypothetical protein